MQTLGRTYEDWMCSAIHSAQADYLEEIDMAYIYSKCLVGPAQKCRIFAGIIDVCLTKEHEWRCVSRSKEYTQKKVAVSQSTIQNAQLQQEPILYEYPATHLFRLWSPNLRLRKIFSWIRFRYMHTRPKTLT